MALGLEVTIEKEVNQVRMNRPHVVVLGAGASRATCIKGDKNGKVLPLMKDLVNVVGLEKIVEKSSLNVNQNFEEIFSDLYKSGRNRTIQTIQQLVDDYFSKLELPDAPSIYDHLILSLRNKDLIATFNWDPLLIQAYRRNSLVGLSLPRLAFLHGNVSVGYCEKDKISGLVNSPCKKCGKIYKQSPILYPIKKHYADNIFIANEWKQLKWGFENAFMITIFGYSSPKIDQEAIAAMKEAWGNKNQRSLEQTEIITIENKSTVLRSWDPFIHTHHYDIHKDFYHSWIANHPRRTGEAWANQYIEAKFIANNPIPRNLNFSELWKWYSQFKKSEI